MLVLTAGIPNSQLQLTYKKKYTKGGGAGGGWKGDTYIKWYYNL